MFIGFKNGKLVTRTAEEKKKQPTIKDTSKKVRKKIRKDVTKNESKHNERVS